MTVIPAEVVFAVRWCDAQTVPSSVLTGIIQGAERASSAYSAKYGKSGS